MLQNQIENVIVIQLSMAPSGTESLATPVKCTWMEAIVNLVSTVGIHHIKILRANGKIRIKFAAQTLPVSV